MYWPNWLLHCRLRSQPVSPSLPDHLPSHSQGNHCRQMKATSESEIWSPQLPQTHQIQLTSASQHYRKLFSDQWRQVQGSSECVWHWIATAWCGGVAAQCLNPYDHPFALLSPHCWGHPQLQVSRFWRRSFPMLVPAKPLCSLTSCRDSVSFEKWKVHPPVCSTTACLLIALLRKRGKRRMAECAICICHALAPMQSTPAAFLSHMALMAASKS